MKIRNNNQLDLEGNNGEQITVQITATGTVSAVSFDLDGVAGNANILQPFVLNKANADPSVLVLFFTFSNKKGGVYNITISGNGGGDISHNMVAQMFGEKENAIAYAINVI